MSLRDLSAARLDAEFDRLSDLRDSCNRSMQEIREEKSRRRDEEIEALKEQIEAGQINDRR